MKSNFYFTLVFTFLSFVASSQTWTQKASLPGTAQDHSAGVSFTLNGKIYFVGGTYSKELIQYNPGNNTWTAKAPIPGTTVSRGYAISFVINGKAYVGLGADFVGPPTYASNEKNDLWEYDDMGNTWTPKASLPAIGRRASASFVINNKGYVVGGYDTANNATNEVWEYDPSANTWTAKANFPGGNIYNCVAGAVNGKGYVSLGSTKVGTTSTPFLGNYEYSPTTNTWLAKSNFPSTPRTGAVSFVLNNKIYFGLGHYTIGTTNNYENSIYPYNPANDNWETPIANFPGSPRSSSAGTVLNNKAYLGTGTTFVGSNTYYKDWYEFSTTTGINGIGGTTAGSEIVCFPNPTKDMLYVNQPQQAGKVSYEIFNAVGQKVLSGNMNNNSIDIHGITPGQYYLALSSNNHKYYNTRITIMP